MSRTPPPKPDVSITPKRRAPSEWGPRLVPQPAPGRRMGGPRTPTLKEPAARAQRATLVARDATAVAAGSASAPRTAGVPSGARPRDPHALAWDPLGRDRLTPDERRRLGDLCRLGNCDLVQVYRGNGTRYANNLRADVLWVSGGRSVTLGNRIFLGDADLNRFEVLAHEVHHTTQYQRWGAAKYFTRGAAERLNELRGKDPYAYVLDGRPFAEYGMEQQGKIVEDYVRGFPAARRIPGVPRVGP